MKSLENKIRKVFELKANPLTNKVVIYSLAAALLSNCGIAPKNNQGENEKDALKHEDAAKFDTFEISNHEEDTTPDDSPYEIFTPEVLTEDSLEDTYHPDYVSDISLQKDSYPEALIKDTLVNNDSYLDTFSGGIDTSQDSHLDTYHAKDLIKEDTSFEDAHQDILPLGDDAGEVSGPDIFCFQEQYYLDKDKDGYGDKTSPKLFCSEEIIPEYVLEKEDDWDCNDNDSLINPAAIEVCDAADNNCNGKIDEGLTLKQQCGDTDVGECQYGVELNFCLGGEYIGWQVCDAIYSKEEVCDGKDNNCDGKTDEGLLLQQKCGTTDTGECSYGVEFNFCVGKYTGWQLCDAVFPTEETCDGKDNNCNGLTDEGLTLEQECGITVEGECELGVEYNYCKKGAYTGWMDCTAIFPAEEKCNNTDDDCDGEIDDGLTLKQECGFNSVGECSLGMESNFCAGGQYTGWKNCTAIFPKEEVCDNLDNDCDDKTDEDLTLEKTCGVSGVGNCVLGIESNYCEDGEYSGWLGCDAVFPSTEICNGIDDDCNGVVDGGLTLEQECGITNVGECTLSSEFSYCINGEYGEWLGCKAVLPALEICDGLDNNCGGAADETFPLGEKCSEGKGICKSEGTVKCAPDGFSVYCHAVPSLPAAETCDNLDNNCNGLNDENLTQSCYSICGEGIEVCTTGVWTNCSAPLPELEICNYFDDDCDGKTDEEFNVGEVCYLGQGECKSSGILECTADGFDTYCNAVPGLPLSEECDTLDNNCDGSTDENLAKTCSSLCGTGVEVCVNGSWTNCDAPLPQMEICDYADNDCDGAVDEEFGVGETCYLGIGECQASGLVECAVDGFTAYCTAVPNEPKIEICNSLDDNCNGTVDENLVKDCSTACGSGLENCVSGKWVNCTALQPQTEVCDGKDNDCNGKIDELTECCPLVGYWNFDEGTGSIVYDSSSYENNGTISGAVWAVGKVNGALSFDGDDKVTILSSDSLKLPDSFSLQAWVYPTEASLSAHFHILSKSNNDYYGGGKNYELNYSPGYSPNEGMFMVNGGLIDGIYAEGPYPINKWYHVVGTFDEKEKLFKIYVNGTLANSKVSTKPSVIPNDAPLIIGYGTVASYFKYFKGLIDEVKIYSCPITDAQVLLEYTNGTKKN